MTPEQQAKIVSELPKRLEKKYPDILVRLVALNQWIYKSLAIEPITKKPTTVLSNLSGICGNRDNLFRAICKEWHLKSRRVSLIGIPHHIGHVGTEVWVEGEWRFYDSTLGVHFTVGNESKAISIALVRSLWPNVRTRRVVGPAYLGKPTYVKLASSIVESESFSQPDTVSGSIKYSSMYINNELQYDPSDKDFIVPIPLNLDVSNAYEYRHDKGIECLECQGNDAKAYIPYISTLRNNGNGTSVTHQYIISTMDVKCVTIKYDFRGNDKFDEDVFQIVLRHFNQEIFSNASYHFELSKNDRVLTFKFLAFPNASSFAIRLSRQLVLYTGSIKITSTSLDADSWALAHYDWHLAELSDIEKILVTAGRFFTGGHDIKKDISIAYSLYDRAANSGVGFAKYMRAYISLNEKGFKRDISTDINDLQSSLASGVTLSALQLTKLSFEKKKSNLITTEVKKALNTLKIGGNSEAVTYSEKLG